MSALSRFEQFIEQIMEGSFTRLLRSQLQPVEIAKRLGRAMEDSQVVGAGGRKVVANRYDVLLNPQDFSLFEPYQASLEREMAEYVATAAKEQHFTLASKPSVSISASNAAMPKRPLVRASKADATAPPRTTGAAQPGDEAALEGHTTRLNVNIAPSTGRSSTSGADPRPAPTRVSAYLQVQSHVPADRIPICRLPFGIGRGLDNDLVLEDVRVSRHHARIEEMNRRLLLVDLRSTNGTAVNGESISRCLLSNGDVISLGGLGLRLAIEEKS